MCRTDRHRLTGLASVAAGLACTTLLAAPTASLAQPAQPSDDAQLAAAADSALAESLPAAREGFVTQLVDSTYRKRGSGPPKPPADIYRRIHYRSPAGKLAAYVTPDPDDGGKHPALIWAHGGYSGIGSSAWQAPYIQVFRDAGFVIMCPSWRGENNNPGEPERFYGEVDDALAAIDYVRALPYVDPDRVYMAGHSTGGTVTMLTALSTTELRAAFSFGGDPNTGRIAAELIEHSDAPHVADPREVTLRSASHFVSTLQVPTLYFEGSDSYYAVEAEDMMERAQAANAPFFAYTVTGADHFNILEPIAALLADQLQQDDREAFRIAIDETAVNLVFDGYITALLAGQRTATAPEWERALAGAVDTDQLSRALRLGSTGMDKFPDSAGIAYLYGQTLSRTLQHQAATDVFHKASSLAPTDVDILVAAAYNQWTLEHLDETRALIERATALEPQHPELIELTAAFAQERRIIAGDISEPPPGSASATAHELLTKLASAPVEEWRRYIDPDALDQLTTSVARELHATPDDWDDSDTDKLLRDMRKVVREKQLVGEYIGFEILSPASEEEFLNEDGSTTVNATLLTRAEGSDDDVDKLWLALSAPALEQYQDPDTMSILRGLDTTDRAAFINRYAEMPAGVVWNQAQVQLRRDPDGRWQVIDVGLNGNIWASHLPEMYRAAVASGAASKAPSAPPSKLRAYVAAYLDFIEALTIPSIVITIIFVSAWSRRRRHERSMRDITQ
ncbi:MAG: hypothetical protein Tsb0020_14160 [Haliangiales bacterium]